MVAKIINTNSVIELEYSHTFEDVVWYKDKSGKSYHNKELQIIDNGETLDYWEKLKHQYAGMIKLVNIGLVVQCGWILMTSPK